MERNPRAVRLCRSENFIPFNIVVVVVAVVGVFFVFYSFAAFIAFSSGSSVCGALAAGFTTRNRIDFSFSAADVYVFGRADTKNEKKKMVTNKRQCGCTHRVLREM